MVAFDRGDRAGGEATHLADQLQRVARQEVARQHHHVITAITQRRQVQVHDVEPVVQVLAETTGLGLGLQVAVGGGDDPNVDRLARGVAHPGYRAVLQRAQDLHLQGHRHLADLVEQQGPFVGHLEPAGLAGHRAGERSAHVAEQL